jgi:hypothetical protein
VSALYAIPPDHLDVLEMVEDIGNHPTGTDVLRWVLAQGVEIRSDDLTPRGCVFVVDVGGIGG